jgi:hypothetical protein
LTQTHHNGIRVYFQQLGAEIGLCTSSRERLGTCYAEPTQRRVRIAGVSVGVTVVGEGVEKALG